MRWLNECPRRALGSIGLEVRTGKHVEPSYEPDRPGRWCFGGVPVVSLVWCPFRDGVYSCRAIPSFALRFSQLVRTP
eukprot:2308205-Pyramimonas_sp.AAC.1